jgi:uncharacterized protein
VSAKTETARRRARTVVELDDPARRAIAEADAAAVLTGEPPLLLDERQRVPAIWDAVRRAVDRQANPGRFLLTGSASPATPPTHSGAGRIATIRMRPLALSERGLARPAVSLRALLHGGASVDGRSEVALSDYVEEIVRSGYPGLRRLGTRCSARPLCRCNVGNDAGS